MEIGCDIVHPGLPVRDVRASVVFYTAKLGFVEAFVVGEPPSMAGVNLGRVQVFLEATPEPRPGMAYFIVDAVDELHEHHRGQGVDVLAPLRDQPWGMRDYAVRDPDGNVLTFAQRLHDTQPPLEVERVELTVRIEKRLAAVLRDLAARQRTTVDSALEEILLHTNDGVTPHTESTVRHIQQLKRKHGIDYDTHASYRFVERGERRG